MEELNLSHVIAREENIRVLAGRFGFSNEVSVLASGWYPGIKVITLNLVIQKAEELPAMSPNSHLLAIKLSELLNCKIKLLELERKPSNSALLSDEVALCRLFDVQSLEEVKLKGLDKNASHYAEHLMQANAYLADAPQNALTLETAAWARKQLRRSSSP